jgi:hypothetical protein
MEERRASSARKFGDGGEKLAGVGIFRLLKDLLGGAGLDELARTHDGDARGQLGDDGQAVRDENIRERKLALEFLKQQEQLGATETSSAGAIP